MEVLGLLFQQRHQKFRLRVAGVAAGDQDRVNARQLFEDLAPFIQSELDCFRIAVIPIERRIPNPYVQPIFIADARYADHRVDLWQWKMRTVGGVIGTRRNQLNGVRAKDGQVAYVLLPHRQRPAVVGIGLRAIAELMPAQRVFRRRNDVEAVGQGDLALRHPQRAQQAADAEEYAARVIASDRDRIARGFDLIAFADERGFVPASARRAVDRDEGGSFVRRLVDARPAQLRALFDLFNQRQHGFVFRAGKVRRGDDYGAGEINFRFRDHPA